MPSTIGVEALWSTLCSQHGGSGRIRNKGLEAVHVWFAQPLWASHPQRKDSRTSSHEQHNELRVTRPCFLTLMSLGGSRLQHRDATGMGCNCEVCSSGVVDADFDRHALGEARIHDKAMLVGITLLSGAYDKRTPRETFWTHLWEGNLCAEPRRPSMLHTGCVKNMAMKRC